MEGLLFLVRFIKITLLLHLELKMFDFGGSGISAGIHLAFNPLHPGVAYLYPILSNAGL